jgi:DNA ligase (NAD+)
MTDIAGKKFCFTGGLDSMTRKEAHELVEEKGGIPKTSVVKDLDYLVSNAEEETTKIKNAREQGTKIITEQEFLALVK